MSHSKQTGKQVSSTTPVSLSRTLDIIGDPWTMQILKESFLGTRRFQDFQQRLGIPRQTLILRLTRLTEKQLYYKKPVQRNRLIYEYRLTAKGIDLYPVILFIWRWHKHWGLNPTELPARLVHQTCGAQLEPHLVCRRCHEDLSPDNIKLRPLSYKQKQHNKPSRRARIGNRIDLKSTQNMGTLVVGDSWSLMVLNAIMHGISTYDALHNGLGISSNVLSTRLKTLLALELLEQDQSESDRRMFHYAATKKGEDVYPIIMGLTQWGERWLAGTEGSPELLVHTPCDSIDGFIMICENCGQRIRLEDVRQDKLAGR